MHEAHCMLLLEVLLLLISTWNYHGALNGELEWH